MSTIEMGNFDPLDVLMGYLYPICFYSILYGMIA